MANAIKRNLITKYLSVLFGFLFDNQQEMDRQRILGQIGASQQQQTAGMATMLQGLQGLGDTALSAGLESEKIKAGYYAGKGTGTQGTQGSKEKGGTIEKTPGEFSHEKNPIDVVQDGTKIAEMTGTTRSSDFS